MCKASGMPEDDRLIGSSEASQILGIDRATLTRWVRSGKLTAVEKLPGSNGAYLFRYGLVARKAAKRRVA